MSTSTANLQQEDFPVGYAEHADNYNQIDDNTVFYVEWLDDNSEFPGLSSSASSNDSNLTDGNWELLQRKELNDEEHTLIPVEDNDWSKLTTPGNHELYVYIAEKNAAELQSAKRTVQPLWPNISKTNIKKNKNGEEENITIDEDNYQDDLAYELFDIHKSQSRRANRMTQKRQLHNLKNVELYVEGVLRLTNSGHNKTDVTWVPYEKNATAIDQHSKKNVLDTYRFNLPLSTILTNKATALAFTTKFVHKTKIVSSNYTSVTIEPHRNLRLPNASEFSVHSPIVRRQ